MTFLALDKAGVEVVSLALDKDQYEVINHQTGKPAEQTKAKPARRISKTAQRTSKQHHTFNWEDLDLLVIPGGRRGLEESICF